MMLEWWYLTDINLRPLSKSVPVEETQNSSYGDLFVRILISLKSMSLGSALYLQ